MPTDAFANNSRLKEEDYRPKKIDRSDNAFPNVGEFADLFRRAENLLYPNAKSLSKVPMGGFSTTT